MAYRRPAGLPAALSALKAEGLRLIKSGSFGLLCLPWATAETAAPSCVYGRCAGSWLRSPVKWFASLSGLSRTRGVVLLAGVSDRKSACASVMLLSNVRAGVGRGVTFRCRVRGTPFSLTSLYGHAPQGIADIVALSRGGAPGLKLGRPFRRRAGTSRRRHYLRYWRLR